MPPATGKFKPFPRVKHWEGGTGNQKRPYDLEALRELFLEGPDYDWQAFCDRHGFNRTYRIINRSDFSGWKREWLKRHAQVNDEEIGPELLDLRRAVTVKRIGFVHDWVKRSQYMKVLLDATLSAHGSALQHDQKHAVMIARGEIERKFSLNGDDLNTLASAAARIQDIEMKSLMLVSGGLNSGVQLPQLGPPDEGSVIDDERPTMQISTMGGTGMSAVDSAKLLASWFDQVEKAVEPAVVVEPQEDLPDAGDAG